MYREGTRGKKGLFRSFWIDQVPEEEIQQEHAILLSLFSFHPSLRVGQGNYPSRQQTAFQIPQKCNNFLLCEAVIDCGIAIRGIEVN